MKTDIRLMVVDFQLEGCGSLKERRHRLGGLRDRFGKRPELAVTDLSDSDEPSVARWGFLALTRSPVDSERFLREVEEWLGRHVDARITDLFTEAL